MQTSCARCEFDQFSISGCGPLPMSDGLFWKTKSGRQVQTNSTVYEVYTPQCRNSELNRDTANVRCWETLRWDVDPADFRCTGTLRRTCLAKNAHFSKNKIASLEILRRFIFQIFHSVLLSALLVSTLCNLNACAYLYTDVFDMMR